MTTITIKNGDELSKTNFDSTQELFSFLRNKLSPIQLFAVDEESLTKESLEKIR